MNAMTVSNGYFRRFLAAAALGGGLWKRFRGKKAEQQQP